MTFSIIVIFGLILLVFFLLIYIAANDRYSRRRPVADRSVIAFRYLGTFSNKKRTWATLERLGDFTSFEVPPEWLPDDIEPNNLVQVETDKPDGIFAMRIVESPEAADNYEGEDSYED